MKTFLLIAAMLSLSAAPALAAGGAPYTLDAKGKCHSADGKFAKQALCTPKPASKHCRDPKTGKYAKCSAPGAVPA